MMRVWIGRSIRARSDRADAPVHHVAGRHDVHAGLGLHQRLLHQHGHGFVVEDVARVVQQPSWPWLVKGSSATSVITPSSGNAF
jgi:hypothetical protein